VGYGVGVVVFLRVGEGGGESSESAVVVFTTAAVLVGRISGSILASVVLRIWVGNGVKVGTGANRVGMGCASIEHPASKMIMGKRRANTACRT
jgi:hypothetical protein